ncbi:MAG: D-glycero-beta-D-manno-heptose 1,7-bisphosphate 7-phosphatase [Gammaproteobacteria bacterium]
MPEGPASLVILDRDGVINRDSEAYIRCADEFDSLPGSIEAIGELCRAGFRVAVASNQSGVGRGLFSAEDLENIHAKLRAEVEAAGGSLAGIFVCPHTPEDDCDCRKPRPGLLRQAAAALASDLDGVPVIGDSARDLDAALAAEAQPVLVRTGNGRRTESDLGADSPIRVYDDLRAAAAAIIAERRRAVS